MFYKYVNNRISYRSTIGALIGENDTIVTSDSDKANMFNEYYESVGVVNDGIIPPCPHVGLAVKSTIESIRFDEVSVLAAIHKVKPNPSAGPDGLPPLLFKQLRYTSLAHPLALLYNQLFPLVLFHRPPLYPSLIKAQPVLWGADVSTTRRFDDKPLIDRRFADRGRTFRRRIFGTFRRQLLDVCVVVICRFNTVLRVRVILSAGDVDCSFPASFAFPPWFLGIWFNGQFIHRLHCCAVLHWMTVRGNKPVEG